MPWRCAGSRLRLGHTANSAPDDTQSLDRASLGECPDYGAIRSPNWPSMTNLSVRCPSSLVAPKNTGSLGTRSRRAKGSWNCRRPSKQPCCRVALQVPPSRQLQGGLFFVPGTRLGAFEQARVNPPGPLLAASSVRRWQLHRRVVPSWLQGQFALYLRGFHSA